MLKKMIKSGSEQTKLLLVDDLHPEDLAMVQAYYSRSPESAETRIEELYADRHERFAEAGRMAGLSDRDAYLLATSIEATSSLHASNKARRLMAQSYIGYNHASIGDCGSTTFFVENVSLLAAKAIQDNPLYNGQETSTRYIDMSKQSVCDPLNNAASAAIQCRWMEFYTKNQERVAAEVRRRHPRLAAEDVKAYEGAVKARTFDIMRAWLPAGIRTKLSWHSNLRQIGDNLGRLCNHPLAEVQDIGDGLFALATERYSSSFKTVGGEKGNVQGPIGAGVSGDLSADVTAEQWEEDIYHEHAYQPPANAQEFSSALLNEVDSDIHESRPRGRRLPHWMTDAGFFTWRFMLDFGSFRDIQRQRNGVCRMPLLTTHYGFEQWYLEQLPEDLQVEALSLIEEQIEALDKITDDRVKQYYVALGFKVDCSVTYGLPAALYVMELRSGKMIHPTLRRVVHEMVGQFRERFPRVKVHADMSRDDWSVRRGTQTIERLK